MLLTKRKIRYVILLLCLFLTKGVFCTTPFENAEELFQKQDYTKAQGIYENILQNPPSLKQKAIAQCRLGIIFSSHNETAKARQYLEKGLNSKELPPSLVPYCEYALLQIFILRNEMRDGGNFISKNRGFLIDLDAQYQARYYALSAEIAKRLNDVILEMQQLKNLHEVMIKSGIYSVTLKVLNNKVITLSDVTTRLAFHEALDKRIAAKNFLEDVLVQKIQQQNFDAALRLIQMDDKHLTLNFLKKDLNIDKEKFLSWLNKSAKLSREGTFKIGVVFVKDDKFVKFNNKIKEALAAFFQSDLVKNASINVVFKEVEMDAVENAARDLIFDDCVSALLGPLTVKLMQIVTKNYDFLNIPIFYLGELFENADIKNSNIVDMAKLENKANGKYLAFLNRTLRKPENALLLERRAFDVLVLVAGFQQFLAKEKKVPFKDYLFAEKWKIEGSVILQGPISRGE